MSQSTTFEQLPLFSFDTVPYGYCPNCYMSGGLGERSDIPVIQCWNCNTTVDSSRWEKRVEPKSNLHLRALVDKYNTDTQDDW